MSPELRMTINGAERTAAVEPSTVLVDALRDDFGLTGTHVGCRTGDCGACTVQVDGRIVKSCLMLAHGCEGAEVVTLEGFSNGAELDPLQEAFWAEHGFQCGYCLPGMLFAARELLESTPDPSEEEIRSAIDGNLCRCTGYHNIVEAIASGARARRAAA